MKELLRGRSGRKYMMHANLKASSDFSRNYGWNPSSTHFQKKMKKTDVVSQKKDEETEVQS